MQENQWEVQISQVPGTMGKQIFIFHRGFNGKVEVLQPDFDTVQTFNAGDAISPTIKYIDRNVLQAFMDAMMGVGFKPTEASYTQGKLEATNVHLSDLRRLLKLSSN